MKFIHAADLHIDSPLRGLVRYEGAPVDEIRLASRRAFENLTTIAVERGVDLVVLAGDVFDGHWKDLSTGQFFSNQMEKLRAHHIPVAMVRGNHDAQSKMTESLRLPDNVHVFPARRAETKVYQSLGVAVHGQSFAKQKVTKDLAAKYPESVDGLFNIGILHTALAGRDGHASYAPTTVEVLKNRGYDYWALGHVHQREVVCEDPWIVFPGNLQGRHIKETGAKGATLVHAKNGAVERLEPLYCDVFRFAQLQMSIDGLDDWDDLVERWRAALTIESDRAQGRSLAVRLTLTGAGELHEYIHRHRDGREAELRAAATGLGASQASEVWVERIVLKTKATPETIASLLDRTDAIGDIARAASLMAQVSSTTDSREVSSIADNNHASEIGGPTSLSAELETILKPVLTSVPAELRAETDEAGGPPIVTDALMTEAANMLLSRLQEVDAP